MRQLIASLLLIAAIACQNPTFSSPTPIPGPTVYEEPPGPQQVDLPFEWEGARGFSLFAGLKLDEQDIHAAYNQGFNTARVCAETEFWNGSDDYPRVPRNLTVLRDFLRTVATIPGAQVLLVANCTLKHGHGVGWEEQRQWNVDVAHVAGEYQNIAIEVVNEPWHFGHFFHGRERDVRQLMHEARQACACQVGVDDHFRPNDTRLRHEHATQADFLSFHPARDYNGKPWDPDREFMRKLKDANPGQQIVFSETVAWDDNGDDCQHFLRTCNTQRITKYEARAKRERIVFFFHSEDGLAARVPFSWVPPSP